MAGPARARRLPVLALLVASSGAALGLAEVAARVVSPAAASRVRYPCFYEEDARFGYRYIPGAEARVSAHFEIDQLARINSLGFHDEEPLPKDASEWRVLAVGDSFTAGLNLPRDAVWTAVLERELRAAGFASADVVNLGLDGTGTDVHRDLIEAFLPEFRPQTVVLAFYANDLLDVLHGRFRRECHRGYVLSYQDDLQRLVLRQRVDAHLEGTQLRALFEHSHLVRLSLHALLGNRNLYRMNFVQSSLAELGIDLPEREARRPRLRAVWEEVRALASRCGCRFVVVPVPPRRSLSGSRDVLVSQVGDVGLPIVDVVPSIERALDQKGLARGDLYWVHDNHLNAAGNELFGRAVAEALLSAANAAPAAP
jgi:lysophospholipase L1-like esterase